MSSVPLKAEDAKKVDVLLVGGGIMSASLGIWLNELNPNLSMEMVERLDGVAKESSFGWNNAGTGHAALAELNYTPQDKDGKVDISKAVEINENFQISRQFWAYLVKTGVLKKTKSFINHTPHMSFVWGEQNIAFLKARFAALQGNPLFSGMQYSEDREQIKKWAPLMIIDRDPKQHIAATWSPLGTDMNYGEVTRQYVSHLQTKPNFNLKLNSEVRDIVRNTDGTWHVSYTNLKTGTSTSVDAKKLFIGAGGGSLRLLQKSGIPEANDYAGFPVGGSFLVTDNPEVTSQHLAKAYGKAPTGSPPMAVPHLDTRMLNGKRVILFGPFATFSTKFLKEGSYLDLFGTTTVHNVWPMAKVGIDQYALMEYLAGQLMLSDDDRMSALREYFPDAKKEDWKLWQAGQRVQIIKRDREKGGVLKLGTEIVTSKDTSIGGLLGASPGASTAAPIMLNVVEKMFKDEVKTPQWQAKIREIVPSYGTRLNASAEATERELTYTSKILELPAPPAIIQPTPTKDVAPVDIGNQPVRKLKAATDMAL